MHPGSRQCTILGLICIEKWSQNFDLGTRSAIFGTPKMAKMIPLLTVLKSILDNDERMFDAPFIQNHS